MRVVLTGCTKLTNIQLPDSITTIGSSAFKDCISLSAVRFPGSLSTPLLGGQFAGCFNIETVTIPATVTDFGYGVFNGFSRISEFIVETGNPNYSVYDGVLFNKDRTTLVLFPSARFAEYDIPEGVTKIADYAFAGCTHLSGVTIPNSVTSIGVFAFSTCSILGEITIPNSVTSIDMYAFASCSNLGTVTNECLSQQTIGSNIFSNAGTAVSDKKAYVKSVNTNFTNAAKTPGYTVYNDIDFGATISGTLNTNTGVLSVDGTGDMPDYSDLTPCKNLVKSVVIGNGITSIGQDNFSGCANLTDVSISNSVTAIGIEAFSDCPVLTTIEIPENVATIEDAAFQGDSALATIINYHDGNQVLGLSVLDGAGSSVTENKQSSIKSSNTTFAALAAATGYVINGVEGSSDVIPVNGTINATIVSVTHPVSVNYAINPDLGRADGALIAPDIAVTNNGVTPVKVSVAAFISVSGGSMKFIDVGSDLYQWDKLGKADSKKYIALGLKVKNDIGWKTGYNADPQYAININNTLFGIIGSKSTGVLNIVANYGLAFDQTITAKHNLIFSFSLV